jgi:ABC-2 type transport system ATP-binding protein
VDENIEFFAEIHGVGAYRARREELLEFTRLAPFRGRLADKLSGGMKQKLALACTLVHTPDIIFLDEPTTGVDPVSRRDFWKILSNLLKTGITIVLTTPYLDEAERCSRVGLMDRGRLLMADTPHGLKARMRGTILEIICPVPREARSLIKDLAGVREVQTFGDRLNVAVEEDASGGKAVRRALSKGSLSPAMIRTIPPSLENVFISLVKPGGQA